MKKRVLVLLIAFVLLLMTPSQVYASSNTQSTSYTMTKTIDGDKAISQDAYLPYGTYGDLNLNSPQDLYVGNGKLYIADTGNSRAVIVNIETEEVQIIGEGLLKEPRGIAADADGKIYIADTAGEAAYRFASDGTLEIIFEKPTEPAYGKNVGFKPVKVAPGDEGGVYLVCEGTKAGVVQISGYGNFLGYFASNDVEMSIIEKIIDSVLTKEQKKMFMKKAPASFGNVFRGSDKLIYTINKGQNIKPKKHSISGLNMLKQNTEIPQMSNTVDIHITNDGRIYVLDERGQITEITSDGYLLCTFGGFANGNNRIGLFDVPVGLGVDEVGNVYVLDRENGITVFENTPVQDNIYKAINLYQNGLYGDSQEVLDEVLKFNDASYLAHIYSAKNYMQQANYESAQKHFKIANDKGGYSDAYWEIRNVWLQTNLGYIILVGLALFIFYLVLKKIDQKTNVLAPIHEVQNKIKKNRYLSDLGKMMYVMKHPIDGAYYIKTREIGSVAGATTIYVALFVILVLYQTATGFIFAQPIEKYSIVNVFTTFLVLLVLFISMHYLISSINDGLGTPRSIYTCLAYSFSPFVIFMPIIIIICNFSTINDQFFIEFVLGALLIWAISNTIAGFIEIHDYKLSEMVKNLLITAFTIGVAILGMSVVYLMANQIVTFVYEIIVEVSLRV